MMIVIVDFGIGNLNSVLNKLVRIGANAIISSHSEDIEKADKLILPGVGSFSTGMENLEKYNILSVLDKKVNLDKTPILGICLGMQLFSERSEEGEAKGLGWLSAETKRFRFEGNNKRLKIPHMGWNTLNFRRDSKLLKGITSEDSFYFVHSFHFVSHTEHNVITNTCYGYDFASVIQKDNIYGTQFHPEKSHASGLKILRNFVELT